VPVSRSNDVVVLLPTFNECDNLLAIVEAIRTQISADIIILDDASTDGTADLADNLADAHKGIEVVHRPGPRGLGPSYIEGFEKAVAAGYDKIIQMDADFSHDPKNLPQMLTLADEYDLVIGSRWAAGGGTQGWPWHRRLISQCGSRYAQLALHSNIRDLTAGFKCWRRHALNAVDLAAIRSTGYAFQIEMTYSAQRAGLQLCEHPIVFLERRVGQSKMSWRIVAEAVWRVPLLRMRK